MLLGVDFIDKVLFKDVEKLPAESEVHLESMAFLKGSVQEAVNYAVVFQMLNQACFKHFLRAFSSHENLISIVLSV